VSATPPKGFLAIDPEIESQLLSTKLGIEITDWTPQRMVATMPVKGNLQPYGLLHGGANAVLAETLGSIAAALNAPRGLAVLGLELSCTHHRAATTGYVTAVCTPIHAGRSTATYEVVISDEDGKRTCTSKLTCILREGVPGRKK